MSKLNIILVVIAALMGFFFGNAMDADIFGVHVGGLIWGIILAVISAALAWVVANRTHDTEVNVEENSLAHFLFKDVRSGVLWLPVRLFVGSDWLSAGLHKMGDPKWMDTGVALQGYWKSAVAIPNAPAHAAITYDWWRGFLQGLLDSNSYVWFGKLIAIGETLIGLGLIFGALVGVASFFGILMNTSFLLSGSTSSNPILLILGIGLILAWKVAGWIGIDRYLLPSLGTPWHKGTLLRGKSTPARPVTTSTT